MNRHFLIKKNFSIEIANVLRKRILLNELKKDYHLKENELSDLFSTSRGPVREAIYILENEGLVKTPKNGRTVVVGLTKKDLQDLWECRLNLECFAIKTIINKNLNNDMESLTTMIKKMRLENNHNKRIKLDLDFHWLLINKSENRSLIKLWSSLRNLIGTLVEISTDFYGEKDYLDNTHEEIIKAITNNQYERAVSILEDHFKVGFETVSSHMDAKEEKE